MKIFALCLGIICSVVALAIYSYFIKLRIKEAKKADDERPQHFVISNNEDKC